jgi:hypothetical protein
LLDAVITPDFISNTRRDIDNLLATQGDRVLDSKKRLWIHVSNLETQLVGVESRKQVLQLMEKLLERGPTQPPRVVAVTSSVDPVAHFEEIFRDEREGTYEDFIPEVELSRSSLLLSRFRRCYVRIQPKQTNPWRNYEPTKWRKVLAWEVAGYEPLSQIEEEVERAFPGAGSVSLDDLAHAITTRALAVYQLLWTSCTRREKLALIQLAQEGFVTCQSSDMFAALAAKGLITDGRPPAVFNYTFRAFLRNIERSHVVQEWERMDGNGLWVVVGRLTAGTLVAGAVFFLLTQDYSVESLLPIVSGTGVFGVPLVRSLFARVTGKVTGATDT